MKASMILSLALVGLLAMGDGVGADPPRRGPRPGDFPRRGPRFKEPFRRIPRPPNAPYRVLRPANRPPVSSPATAPAPEPDLGPPPQGTGTAAVIPIMRPALSSERGPHNEGNIYAPEVLFEGGVYRMWYGGQGSDGHDRIHLAVSEDGMKWTRRGVVLSNDEANHVNDPSVVRVGGRYYMFYTRAVVDIVDDIALATSHDGVHWHKEGPVLKPGAAGEWDALCVGRPSIMFENNVFKMWYDGRKDLPLEAPGDAPKSATSTRYVGFATSPDGLHWDKHPQPLFAAGVGAVDVKKINDVFVMAYESGEGTLVAVSTDGINDWKALGVWAPLSGRDFDRYGHVTPMMLVGPRGRLDSIFIGTARAPTWDRNMIARVRLSPAQVAQVTAPAAQASNP